jgi:hypothetical protein
MVACKVWIMRLDIYCLRRIVFALFLTAAGAGVNYGQKPVRCPIENKVTAAPDYRIGRTFRTVEEAPSLLVQISIKPGFYEREEIVALAERLNKEFCKEQRLTVLIFDNNRAAKKFDVNELKLYSEAIRGEYSLDRVSGNEYISFSQDAGKPSERLKIVLNR